MKRTLPLLFTLPLLSFCSKNTPSDLQNDEVKKNRIVLGMNDISIMMPINEQRGLISLLPRLSDMAQPEKFAPGFPALSPETFVPAWAEEQRNQHLFEASPIKESFKDFALVSMRLDPCTNHLQVRKDSACVAEMRLVWQRLSSHEPRRLLDSNVHTLYSLSNAEFKDILKTMGELHASASIDTLSMPLLPNPVIAKEGIMSPYFKGVLGVVHRYARSSRLSEIANMVGHTAIEWSMGHVLVKNGVADSTAIPTLNSEKKLDKVDLSSRLQEVPAVDGEPSFLFANHTASESKISQLRQGSLLSEKALPEAWQDDLNRNSSLGPIIEAFALENPKLFNPKNINCSSCHLTPDQKVNYKFVADKLLGLDLKSLASVFGYTSSKWDLSTPFAKNEVTTLQFFSITSASTISTADEIQPQAEIKYRISARVVNDTADSLDLMEERGYLDLDQVVPEEAVVNIDFAKLLPETKLPVQRDASVVKSRFSGRSQRDVSSELHGMGATIEFGRSWVEGEGILNFDLSSLGEGDIEKAELKLFNLQLIRGVSKTEKIELYLLDGNWSEDAVTWNTRPSDIKLIDSFVVIPGANSLDITSIVNELRAEGKKDLPIGFRSSRSDVSFSSKEGGLSSASYIHINKLN